MDEPTTHPDVAHLATADARQCAHCWAPAECSDWGSCFTAHRLRMKARRRRKRAERYAKEARRFLELAQEDELEARRLAEAWRIHPCPEAQPPSDAVRASITDPGVEP